VLSAREFQFRCCFLRDVRVCGRREEAREFKRQTLFFVGPPRVLLSLHIAAHSLTLPLLRGKIIVTCSKGWAHIDDDDDDDGKRLKSEGRRRSRPSALPHLKLCTQMNKRTNGRSVTGLCRMFPNLINIFELILRASRDDEMRRRSRSKSANCVLIIIHQNEKFKRAETGTEHFGLRRIIKVATWNGKFVMFRSLAPCLMQGEEEEPKEETNERRRILVECHCV
jgi:hypothetical protein